MSIIEVIAGVAIWTWVLIGSFALLFAGNDLLSKTSQLASMESIQKEHVLQLIKEDMNEGITAFCFEGEIVLNGQTFNTQKIKDKLNINAFKSPHAYYSELKRIYGSSLILKQEKGFYSLMVLGIKNEITAMYRIQYRNNGSRHQYAITRLKGDNQIDFTMNLNQEPRRQALAWNDKDKTISLFFPDNAGVLKEHRLRSIFQQGAKL